MIWEYRSHRYDVLDGPRTRIRRVESRIGGVEWRTGNPEWEFRLWWPWTRPHTLHLGDDMYLSIAPFSEDTLLRTGERFSTDGRVSAHVRRYGVTLPIPVGDPRVLDGLRGWEAVGAFR